MAGAMLAYINRWLYGLRYLIKKIGFIDDSIVKNVFQWKCAFFFS